MASIHLPLKVLNSYTSGNKPSLELLKRGELAINMADNKLFYRTGTGTGDEASDKIHEFSLTVGGIAELEDLLISSPVNNQVLSYNDESGKWENKTLTASMVSDFVAEVKKIALPREGGEVSGKITYAGVDSTTFGPQDLITKEYADAIALGYVPHDPCNTGSSDNVDGVYVDGSDLQHPGVGATFTLSADTGNATSVAGVVLKQGMRVLLVGQTDAKQNGAYTVTTVPAEASGSVVLTRADDFDGAPKISYRGAQFLISEGTNKGSVYRLKNESITFGTDNIEFTLAYTATSYQGGAGISIAGNVVSVKEGATVKVIDSNLEVASGSGNEGKVLTAGADGQAAEWKAVDFSSFVTLDTAQNITGVKTFDVTPKISAEQTVASDGAEAAKVATVKTATTYTDKSESGSTVALGGIPKGTKLENVSVTDVIDQLLHPYVKPGNPSLRLAPTNGGTFEKGSTQTVTSGTVSWTNGSKLITKAEVLSGTPVGETTLSNSASSAQVTITVDPITDNKTFSARITDDQGTYTGGSVAFTFVYPMYSGVIAQGSAVDGEAIVGLKKEIVSKTNRTVAFTTTGTQQAVFAFPASYGNLKSIMDQNNFENIDAFTKSTVAVTGLDKTSQQYNVYVASVNVQGFSYTFKF